MQGITLNCLKNLALFTENPMYKKNQNHQFSLQDFNQPMGLKLDPENKWIKKAAMIPWDEIEAVYADLFPSDCGMPAKPLRMALGALLIQKSLDFLTGNSLNKSRRIHIISILLDCLDSN